MSAVLRRRRRRRRLARLTGRLARRRRAVAIVASHRLLERSKNAGGRRWRRNEAIGGGGRVERAARTSPTVRMSRGAAVAILSSGAAARMMRVVIVRRQPFVAMSMSERVFDVLVVLLLHSILLAERQRRHQRPVAAAVPTDRQIGIRGGALQLLDAKVRLPQLLNEVRAEDDARVECKHSNDEDAVRAKIRFYEALHRFIGVFWVVNEFRHFEVAADEAAIWVGDNEDRHPVYKRARREDQQENKPENWRS